jgi:hypothetical protein
LAHVVSSLAYPNLLGTKRLGCCCCNFRRESGQLQIICGVRTIQIFFFFKKNRNINPESSALCGLKPMNLVNPPPSNLKKVQLSNHPLHQHCVTCDRNHFNANATGMANKPGKQRL